MKPVLTISETIANKKFSEDVKIGSHPRYGKNASWENFINPAPAPARHNQKTYWYAYEMWNGKIGIKYNVEPIFGPAVHEYIEMEETFEKTIFNYWSKQLL